MQILQGHEGPVYALQFSPDGETLISAGKDGAVRRWNAWGESSILLESSEKTNALSISSDSERVAIAGDGGLLGLWSLKRDSPPLVSGNEGPVTGVAFMPDDASIGFAVGNRANDGGASSGSIRIWDWRNKSIRNPPPDVVPTTAVRALTSNTQNRLLAWVTQNQSLTVWPFTRSTTTRFSLKSPCRALAFAPDGKTIAATTDWKVLTFEIERKQERLSLAGHKGVVSTLAYTPDGRYLITGSWDKTVKFWDAISGREVASFEWPVGRVSAVAFAPDGLRAAVAGDTGAIVVWDVDL